jgi:hypothetical protein
MIRTISVTVLGSIAASRAGVSGADRVTRLLQQKSVQVEEIPRQQKVSICRRLSGRVRYRHAMPRVRTKPLRGTSSRTTVASASNRFGLAQCASTISLSFSESGAASL